MLHRIRSRLTYANVMATIAVFGVLGGTVYAANKVDGTTIRRDSLPGNRLEEGSVSGSRLKSFSVTGQQIKDNSVTARQIDAGSLSPRAFGYVSSGGVISDSKNVVANATGPTGVYCIALDPSIDAQTAHVIATVDDLPKDNNGHPIVPLAFATSLGAFLGCTGNSVRVDTYLLADFDGAADVGDSVTKQNEAFTFLVP